MAKLIIALDTADGAWAIGLAKKLAGTVEWFKIGLELFTALGPDIVRTVKGMGFRVFLDLKFYDIPNTVASATKAAMTLNADMLTLHCQGGRRMCEAAINVAQQSDKPPLLFGVTVLTSFEDGEMPGTDLTTHALGELLAKDAAMWGLNGVVCSGREVEKIKTRSPQLLTLCPGIRPAGATRDDQRRIMTPADAVRAGADFLVVGRPITGVTDPVDAAKRILAEMSVD